MNALEWITLAGILVSLLIGVVGPVVAIWESERRRKSAVVKADQQALKDDLNLQRDVADLKTQFHEWKAETQDGQKKIDKHLRLIYRRIESINKSQDLALLRERTRTNSQSIGDQEDRLREIENHCAARDGFRTKRIDCDKRPRPSDSGEHTL